MSLVVLGLHVHLLCAPKKVYPSVSQLSGCRAGMVRPTLIKGRCVTEILVYHFVLQEVWLCTPPYNLFKLNKLFEFIRTHVSAAVAVFPAAKFRAGTKFFEIP